MKRYKIKKPNVSRTTPRKSETKGDARKLEEIESLLDNSEYQKYITSHLLTVKCEIERQLQIYDL